MLIRTPRPIARRLPAPLRERSFRNLFLGQSLSTFGDALIPVALAFAVIRTSGSSADLGLVLAAATTPTVLFVLLGGVAGDRWPRQHVMLSADFIRSCAQATTALLLLLHSIRLWQLLLLQAVWGTAAAFFRPASSALVPQLVPASEVQRANALLGLTQSVAAVTAPAISGLLVATIGPGISFAIDAATFLASALFLARIKTRPASAPVEPASVIAHLRAGWDEFRSRQWLWMLVAYSAVFYCFVIAPFITLGPFEAADYLGGAGAWAMIVSAYGIGSVSGSIGAIKLRPKHPLVTACALLLPFALLAGLLAAHAPLALLFGSAIAGGFGIGVFNALAATVLQQQVPTASLSRVAAYNWLGSTAALPLGLIIAGALASAIGLQSVLTLATGVGILATVVACSVPSIRRVQAKVGPRAASTQPDGSAVHLQMPAAQGLPRTPPASGGSRRRAESPDARRANDMAREPRGLEHEAVTQ